MPFNILGYDTVGPPFWAMCWRLMGLINCPDLGRSKILQFFQKSQIFPEKWPVFKGDCLLTRLHRAFQFNVIYMTQTPQFP